MANFDKGIVKNIIQKIDDNYPSLKYFVREGNVRHKIYGFGTVDFVINSLGVTVVIPPERSGFPALLSVNDKGDPMIGINEGNDGGLDFYRIDDPQQVRFLEDYIIQNFILQEKILRDSSSSVVEQSQKILLRTTDNLGNSLFTF